MLWQGCYTCRSGASITIILLPLGLGGELRTQRQIGRHVDTILVTDIVEAGDGQLVAAFDDLELRQTVRAGERPIGMELDVGACDRRAAIAIKGRDRHLMIGRADDLYGEGA